MVPSQLHGNVMSAANDKVLAVFFGESNVKTISTANLGGVKSVTISKRRKPVRAALNRNSIYCG